MDATTLTLIVAAITGGTGVVQGIIQGTLTGRSASVSARQEAARANIALCDRFPEQVTETGQAANEYALELDEAFLDDWSVRGPMVREATRAHGPALASLAARESVQRALAVAIALPSLARRMTCTPRGCVTGMRSQRAGGARPGTGAPAPNAGGRSPALVVARRVARQQPRPLSPADSTDR